MLSDNGFFVHCFVSSLESYVNILKNESDQSSVRTRAEKSKSIIRWKRGKGGKRREKAEKADLVMQLGKPTCKKSEVFLNIVQKAFDPPPFY